MQNSFPLTQIVITHKENGSVLLSNPRMYPLSCCCCFLLPHIFHSNVSWVYEKQFSAICPTFWRFQYSIYIFLSLFGRTLKSILIVLRVLPAFFVSSGEHLLGAFFFKCHEIFLIQFVKFYSTNFLIVYVILVFLQKL